MHVMCSSDSANGAGVGSSPCGGIVSVQTIVLMLDDPDTRLARDHRSLHTDQLFQIAYGELCKTLNGLCT